MGTHNPSVIHNFYRGPSASAKMPINYLILLSRQGKVRLAKWFTTLSPKEKAKIIKDVSQLVLARRTRMCNFLEYKDSKIVYRRYASLFFIAGCNSTDNELITLERSYPPYAEEGQLRPANRCWCPSLPRRCPRVPRGRD